MPILPPPKSPISTATVPRRTKLAGPMRKSAMRAVRITRGAETYHTTLLRRRQRLHDPGPGEAPTLTKDWTRRGDRLADRQGATG